MESQKKMMVVFGLVAALFLQSDAAVTPHMIDWNIPLTGAQEYKTWASSQNFGVGDSLIFKFGKDVHDVTEVPEKVYETCSFVNDVINAITTSPATIILNSAGMHYYTSTSGNNCQSGQKFAITVSASSGTSPGSSPSAPSTSTTTNTVPTGVLPSSSSPAAGAGFVLCSLSLVVGLFV